PPEIRGGSGVAGAAPPPAAGGSVELKNWSNENPPVSAAAGGGADGAGSTGSGAAPELRPPSSPNTWSSEMLSVAGRVASPGETTPGVGAGSASEWAMANA